MGDVCTERRAASMPWLSGPPSQALDDVQAMEEAALAAFLEAEPERSSINFHVSGLGGKEFELSALSHWSIGQVKDALQRKALTPLREQDLVWEVRVLQDNEKVSEVFGEASVVNLTLIRCA